MPAALSPDKGNIATPNLILFSGIEFTVQAVRYVQALQDCVIVFVLTGLHADKASLTHQASYLESTNIRSAIPQHYDNALTPGRSTVFIKQFVDLAS